MRTPSPKRMDRSAAEDIAVQGLAFLGASQIRLLRFLDSSGLTPESLRSAAQEPGFFAGILGFIVADEPLLLDFAKEIGTTPEAVMAARHVLSPVPDA